MPIESNRHLDTKAVITGGTQGVGWAIATQLVKEGCSHIVLTGRDPLKAKQCIEKLQKMNCVAEFIEIDLTDLQACQELIERSIEHLGTVNSLINAAASSARGSLIDTSITVWDELFDTNTRAPFFLMQAFVRHCLAKKQSGVILNILSQAVYCGQSYLAGYAASKAALATLTKNVANAYRFDRIRCNAILPGWMDTVGEDKTQRKYHKAGDDWLEKAEALQPMKQLVKPDELAKLASYMLSSEAGVMTGSLVDYDQNICGAYPE